MHFYEVEEQKYNKKKIEGLKSNLKNIEDQYFIVPYILLIFIFKIITP